MEEKILEKLEILEKKIDELTAYVKSKEKADINVEYEHSYTPDSITEAPLPSEVASKVMDDNINMMLESERIVCPKCQSVNIQAMDNKEKPLSMSGGIMIYSKKYYCKKCGYQWE
jgi:late competence protein required for DNA uptake (superfamily II DNA/RNA helicase)